MAVQGGRPVAVQSEPNLDIARIAGDLFQLVRIRFRYQVDLIVSIQRIKRYAGAGRDFESILTEDVKIGRPPELRINNEIEVAAPCGKQPVSVCVLTGCQQRSIEHTDADFAVTLFLGLKRVHEHKSAHAIAIAHRKATCIYLHTFDGACIDGTENILVIAHVKRIEQPLPVQHDPHFVTFASTKM